MLDCWYCGDNFPDFTALAEHVKAWHGPNDVPNKLPPLRSGATTERMENRPMAKKAAAKQDDRREFLKHNDLSRRGTTVIEFGDSIRTFDGKFGAQLIIDVTVNGEPFALGIKLNSANHIALEKKLGRNMLKWAGAKVKATVESFEGDRGTVEYIQLEGAGDRDKRDRD